MPTENRKNLFETINNAIYTITKQNNNNKEKFVLSTLNVKNFSLSFILTFSVNK